MQLTRVWYTLAFLNDVINTLATILHGDINSECSIAIQCVLVARIKEPQTL